MPGAITSTAGRRQAHHSDSKVCSSESRQTPNREHSTKSTAHKQSTTSKTSITPIEHKSDPDKSVSGARQTNVSRNTVSDEFSYMLLFSHSFLYRNAHNSPGVPPRWRPVVQAHTWTKHVQSNPRAIPPLLWAARYAMRVVYTNQQLTGFISLVSGSP